LKIKRDGLSGVVDCGFECVFSWPGSTSQPVGGVEAGVGFYGHGGGVPVVGEKLDRVPGGGEGGLGGVGVERYEIGLGLLVRLERGGNGTYTPFPRVDVLEPGGVGHADYAVAITLSSQAEDSFGHGSNPDWKG
jgi:hypothetical protein